MKNYNVNGWNFQLEEEFCNWLSQEYEHYQITPKKERVFEAFKLVKPSQVKVVFLGQDPYPTPGVANGLAFSVNPSIALPKSLKNMYQELDTDLNIKRTNGDLSDIATQGVLFLNTVLTTRVFESNSHQGKGWEVITRKVITDLSERGQVVFVLLGGFAQKFQALIDLEKNKIVKAVHPSPLSAHRGFFGSQIYSQINQYLISYKYDPLDWSEK